MSDSKKSMQPIKNLKKKRSKQRHIPCIIPSETLQAYTNQVTQPQPNQHQPPPQPQFIQPQSLPQHRPSLHQPQPRSTQSIPQTKYRSKQSLHQPQPRSTESIPQPQHPLQSTQSRPQPRPHPQSTQSIPQPRPHPQLTQSLHQPQPRSTESIHQPQHPLQSTQSKPQPRPHPQSTKSTPRPHPQSTQSIPQHQPRSTQSQPPPPPPPKAHSSSSHVGGEDDGNRIPILPEGDGFDKHKLVVSEIASIVRTYMEEGKPSWKKVLKDTRDEWFKYFQKTFTWPPEYKDKVRRNFEKRGAAKMSQLMQEARKDLNQKPTWMGDVVWCQLKDYWKSSTFKKKSRTNRRNRESLDGASLHTGGSIPHRLHWKRMKQEKGADPSLVDFYFRTHRKKDQSWVGVHAKAAYDKFEQKKQELASQIPACSLGENDL